MNFNYGLCASIVRMISIKSLVLHFRGFGKSDLAINILIDLYLIQAIKKKVIVYLYNADSEKCSVR